MAPGLEQSQSLSMQQVLAPHLQQSLQILQATSLELRSMVEQELQSNPILEEEIPPEKKEEPAPNDDFDEEFAALAKLDQEWRDYMAQSGSYTRRDEEAEERRQFRLDSLTAHETLQQHLLSQVGSSDLSPEDRQLAETIIGNIDDAGFLQSSPEQMALATGFASADYARVLAFIQTFDPPGVGAQDLRECLLIQLRRQGKEDTLEYQIVDRFLTELGRKKFPDIARKLGCTPEQIQKAANSIATLNPRPGRTFAPEQDNTVTPDVTVERLGDEYVISLNNEQIPHLRISNLYKDLMAEGEGGREVRDYIRDKIRSGKFLIKSIHQRQQTIQNIAAQIVQRQRDFLMYGPTALKPMTMAQVAEAVGVHETTVSRAISGKYIATPQGTFEMKYFFTPGYKTAQGETLSNTSVKEALAELKSENPRKPLSDSEIVNILSERGIPIARRTVAKYRDELNILPSHMRRTY
jgi:RNA polymerase sigma-54 factor